MLKLFKSKIFLMFLATITILIVIAFSAQQSGGNNWLSNIVSVPMAPLQKMFSVSGNGIEGFFSYFKDMDALKQENNTLRDKIAQLEKEKRELDQFKDENKELKEVLNLKNQFNEYDFIGANIIAKDSGNWFNVFTMDRGGKDGIGTNFPVITNDGLVGRVISSDILSSKVISIIDVDSTVSCRLSKTRDLVLVRGDLALKDEGLCRMDYIPPEVDISVGDTVETSGIGGIFPKGVLVGKVVQVKQTNDELSRYALIEPAVDFKRIEEIFVLKSKSNSEVGNAGK